MIENCKISNPPWTKNDSYSNDFVLSKRDSIVESQNVGGAIVSSVQIEDIDWILVKTIDSKFKIMYNNSGTYLQVGTSRSVGPDQPYSIQKGVSARGELIATDVKIGDAFLLANSYYDGNAGNITYSNVRVYVKNNIIEVAGIKYVSIAGSIGQTAPNTIYWREYSDTTLSGIAEFEPTREYSDQFLGTYRVIRLQQSGIKAKVVVGQYLFFYEDKAGLQGIATRIAYIDPISTADDILVYVESTNKYGRGPYYNSNISLTEAVAIYTNIGEVPLIATNDGLWSYNIIEDNLGSISSVQEVKILSLLNITDLTTYNGNIFVMNKEKVYYSHITGAGSSTINIHLLDILPIRGGKKLTSFGKMLILMGSYDKIITAFTDSVGNTTYVYQDLNFKEDTFSKYSILAYMGSLYMLKSNKIFVKVNIISVNAGEYDIQTEDVMMDTKGLLDNIQGEVYMNIDEKNIFIINHNSGNSIIYSYNIEYQHWSTLKYTGYIYFIYNNIYYGDKLYTVGGNEEVEQKISFVFGTKDIFKLKQFIFIKFVLGIEEDLIDFFLDIEWEVGTKIFRKTINLTSYDVNLNLYEALGGMGSTPIGGTLLGTDKYEANEEVGNICPSNIGVGQTAAIMRFTLRSKINNGFIYGGSIIGYETSLAELTENGYKH